METRPPAIGRKLVNNKISWGWDVWEGTTIIQESDSTSNKLLLLNKIKGTEQNILRLVTSESLRYLHVFHVNLLPYSTTIKKKEKERKKLDKNRNNCSLIWCEGRSKWAMWDYSLSSGRWKRWKREGEGDFCLSRHIHAALWRGLKSQNEWKCSCGCTAGTRGL